MHAAGDPAQHRRTYQGLMEKKAVEEREPALINLPLPLPSIPILDPLLKSIIGGKNQQTPTSTKRTSAAVGPTTRTQLPTGTGAPTNTPSDPGSGDQPGEEDGSGDTGSKSDAGPTGTAEDGSPAGEATHSRVINAGSNPTGFPSNDNGALSLVRGSLEPVTIFSNGVPIATGTIVATGGTETASPTGDGGDRGSGGDGASPGSSPKPKLSGGVIAAVSIIGAIIFIAIFVIVRRRRYIAKRSERKALWWNQTKKETGRFSGSDSVEATAGTQSARSSFATTFDHASNVFAPTSVNSTPPLPPMAELRDSHTTGLLLHSQPQSPIQVPTTPALISFDIPAESNDRRNSTFSTRSGGSDSQAQYLISDQQLGAPVPSPMSVRPFSPSESFAFPKPPPSATGTATPAIVSSDPFVDPVDPVKVTEPWTPLFFGTEVIRRPFVPTLHDEIAVSVGEMVRISKIFDDGWALIEKYPLQDENSKGKKKQIQGLIPVDCLREKGQELSQFISSTRMSSYSAIPEANTATAV